MENKEVNILILGGSGFLGKSIIERLKLKENINIHGTYYENKPKWANDTDFTYFNANVPELDAEFINKIKHSDFVINLMDTSRKDFFENVLFEVPFKIAELSAEYGCKFITLNKSSNAYDTESSYAKTVNRLSNVLKEKGTSIIIASAPVISSESKIIRCIRNLCKYKITPIMGDGSNKIQPIHKTDFSMIISRLVTSSITSGSYYLLGGEAMTIRHIFNLAAQNKIGKPMFVSISEKIFVKYKKIIDSIFETSISSHEISVLGYKENLEGSSLALALKVKPLSLDARIKRDGL